MVKVNGKQYEVVYSFLIGWCGWESDNIGYVVRDGKKLRLVMTNHGNTQFSKQQNLHEKIKEYKDWILQAKNALDILNNQEYNNEMENK
jgi:hypothetical protein